MSDSAIREVVDETSKLLVEAQKSINAIDGRLTALDEEKFSRMGDELNTLSDKLEVFSKKAEERDKETQVISKIVQNISNSTLDNVNSGQFSVAQKEFFKHKRRYLSRKGYQIPEDVQKAYVIDYLARLHSECDSSDITKFANGLITGIDGLGGYFVLPDVRPGVVTRLFETSPIRSLATVSSTTSDTVIRVIDDGEFATGGATSELGKRDTFTEVPKIGKLKLEIHGQWARVFSSVEHLADSTVDEETRLEQKLSDKFARMENFWFVRGDGSEVPRGFMNEEAYPAWTVNTSTDLTTEGIYERGKLETIQTEASGVIALDDLTNLQATLLSGYAANATWVMHRLTWATLLKIKTTFEQPLISVTYMQNGAPAMFLLGDRVIRAADVAKVAGNALAIAYGDFRAGYEVVDRSGMIIIRDNITDPGIIKFNALKRFGGGLISFDTIKRLRIKM